MRASPASRLTGTHSVMDFSARRAALDGEDGRIFDMTSQFFTPEFWAEWLEVPLEVAAIVDDVDLAQTLVKAEANIGLSLNAAVVGRHEGVVNVLLENGALKDNKTHSEQGQNVHSVSHRLKTRCSCLWKEVVLESGRVRGTIAERVVTAET